MAVDRVTVTGTSIISSGSVRKTVDEQVSGIPLPRVSDHDVAQAVLDKYPVAKSVDVGKSLPRTVTVTVTERQPVAATGSPGDYKLIDGDGVTVTTASTPPKGIPVLDIDVSTAGAGAIRAALSAMDALPEHIAKKVESVSATSSSGVEFTLRSGLKIRWGDGHNGKLKAKVLGMLMKTDARYINVSVPKEPTTK
nr:FtsQ-type POTRA domain-containing protein [Spelaeicoccus albus]